MRSDNGSPAGHGGQDEGPSFDGQPRGARIDTPCSVDPLTGLACGAVTGVALCAFAGAALGHWNKLQHPEDPSAGAVSILGAVVAPFGACVGAMFGLLIALQWPRLFRATIKPLAGTIVVLMVAYSVVAWVAAVLDMRRMRDLARPQSVSSESISSDNSASSQRREADSELAPGAGDGFVEP